jgi:hypothetical protein
MFTYKLDPSSRKFTCPKCNKIKRFVKLVDAEGKYLPDEFGRCDRESKCGYQRFPGKNEIDLSNIKIEPTIKTAPSFIPERKVLASLKQYNINPYYQYLCSLFPEQQVLETFKRYRVGTSKYWNGAAIFWQTDLNGNVRSGKIMRCAPNTGKRISKPTPLISWAHKALRLKDFNLQQVMFGLHLINEDITKAICVVESEKTALIMSLYCTDYIWLSTGSLVQFNYERISPLKGRKIVVYPDTDAHEKWVEKAKMLSTHIQTKIHVSELLRESISTEKYQDGLDLADVIQINNPEMKSTPSQVQVLTDDPVVAELMKKFDLYIESLSSL